MHASNERLGRRNEMDRGKYIWMFGLNGCNKEGRKIGEFSVIVLKLSSKPRRLEVRLIYCVI